MNEHPYIRISQKNELFYVTRFDINFLRNTVSFHFREPYIEDDNNSQKVAQYISELNKLGVQTESRIDGIQRRTQIHRIKKIKSFVEESDSSLFPSSVILACNSFDDNELNNIIVGEDVGHFKFPDSTVFTVIDGQHRLAGLLSSNVENFELPVTLFFNISLSMATKMFSDINGNQKAVNKSLIYDLYNNIDEKDYELEREYNEITKNLNENSNSPLYKQIKMLGVGDGTISQAFFIENARKAIEQTNLKNHSKQMKYENLYKYFRAIQVNFPDKWPIIFNEESKLNEEMKKSESQISKTNGIGSLLLLFPAVYNMVNEKITYKEILKRLRNYDWDNIIGTGRSAQKKIHDELLKLLENADV